VARIKLDPAVLRRDLEIREACKSTPKEKPDGKNDSCTDHLCARLDRTAPLILVGRMWPRLIEWARSSMLVVDPPLANPEDMTIPRCVANADEAIALVRGHHQIWLSAQETKGRE